jgi:hypothetical protein
MFNSHRCEYCSSHTHMPRLPSDNPVNPTADLIASLKHNQTYKRQACSSVKIPQHYSGMTIWQYNFMSKEIVISGCKTQRLLFMTHSSAESSINLIGCCCIHHLFVWLQFFHKHTLSVGRNTLPPCPLTQTRAKRFAQRDESGFEYRR